MWIRDTLEELFVDKDFADWYSADGRPGVSPAQLALVSVLQFAENLTDRQAARAVACRIDWKYALGMYLDEPGFDYSVLSEFRDRLAEGDRADGLLALMVDRLATAGLVKRRGRQRTDSTHVLAAVRKLSRIELVGETMRVTLEAIANVDEQWLTPLLTSDWVLRYGQPVGYQRMPSGTAALTQYVLDVGADGIALLQRVYGPDSPALANLAEVEVLRQVWVQQYWYEHNGRLCWREAKTTKARKSREGTSRRPRRGSDEDEAEPAMVPWSSAEIVTPHDPQARFSHKAGKVEWTGYKDHQTETCDEDSPHVIVHVVTTPAPEQDFGALPLIHDALARMEMLPGEHLVDAGYVTPQAIHRARVEHEVTMVGPIRPDMRARERPGFAKEDFQINWHTSTVTCPQEVTSPPWKPTTMDRQAGFSVLFRRADCRACTARTQCTGNVDGRGRHLLLLPKPLQEIQNEARIRQKTPEWRKRYAMRVGAEATVSETVRAHGLRRYRGLAKTHVQHVLTAAGTNIIRLSQQPPPSKRRRPSHFQRLCQQIISPRGT